jgi:hypothetical protein
MSVVLLEATESATGTPINFSERGTVIIGGTFNGGTVSLKMAGTNTEKFVEIDSFTEAEVVTLNIEGGYRLRADFTGSGADVSVEVC